MGYPPDGQGCQSSMANRRPDATCALDVWLVQHELEADNLNLEDNPPPGKPEMTAQMFDFDNSYAALPERLFARLAPTPVSQPELVRINAPLAEHLGLDADALRGSDGINVLAGNSVAAGSDPLAMTSPSSRARPSPSCGFHEPN